MVRGTFGGGAATDEERVPAAATMASQAKGRGTDSALEGSGETGSWAVTSRRPLFQKHWPPGWSLSMTQATSVGWANIPSTTRARCPIGALANKDQRGTADAVANAATSFSEW